MNSTYSDILGWLSEAIEEGRVPSSFVVYDTETYSDQNIKVTGAHKYHESGSTELMMLQYLIVRDGEPQTEQVQVWEYEDPDPVDFMEAVSDGLPMVVFNLIFERVLMEVNLVPFSGYPLPKPFQWIDTASLARALSIQGSLDNTVKAFKIPYEKQKDGQALIRKFCMPRKPTKNNSSVRNYPTDLPEDWARFISYGIMDVWVTLALFTQTLPLSKFETRIQEISYRSNTHGIHIDIEAIQTSIKWVDSISKRLNREVKEITGGITPGQVVALAEWLGLDNLQAATVAEALLNPKLSKEHRTVLKARQVLGKTSVTKLKKMIQCASTGGQVCGGFLYRGAARTGRDAGRLIQPHNFPRPTISKQEIDIVFACIDADDYKEFIAWFENPGEALSSCLRGMIKAPPGKIWCVADYSAIEARGVCWLSGQQDMVEHFHAGRDVYIEMAAFIFGITPRVVDGDQRKTGKDTVLGCGYNMGAPTFKAQADAKDAPITLKLAEKAVKAYREKHPMVVQAWHDCEIAAKKAIRNPGEVFKAMQDKVSFFTGRVGLNTYLFIQLPSGRRLAYLNARLKRRPTSWGEVRPTIEYQSISNGRIITEHTYGGKLVENITQAVARDIMVYGVYKAYKEEYLLIGTVHDEIISEVEDTFDDLTGYENLVCELPPWAEGFPLTAEGYLAKRYRK